MNKLASERELSESTCYVHICFRVTLASIYLMLVSYSPWCVSIFIRPFCENFRAWAGRVPHSSRVQDFSRYAGSARDPLARLEKKLKQHGRYKIFRLNLEQEVFPCERKNLEIQRTRMVIHLDFSFFFLSGKNLKFFEIKNERDRSVDSVKWFLESRNLHQRSHRLKYLRSMLREQK